MKAIATGGVVDDADRVANAVDIMDDHFPFSRLEFASHFGSEKFLSEFSWLNSKVIKVSEGG